MLKEEHEIIITRHHLVLYGPEDGASRLDWGARLACVKKQHEDFRKEKEEEEKEVMQKRTTKVEAGGDSTKRRNKSINKINEVKQDNENNGQNEKNETIAIKEVNETSDTDEARRTRDTNGNREENETNQATNNKLREVKSEPEDNNTNASREDATPKKTFQKCDEGERVFCRQRITNVLGGNPQGTYPTTRRVGEDTYMAVHIQWNPAAPPAPGLDGIVLAAAKHIEEFSNISTEKGGFYVFVARASKKWEFCGVYVLELGEEINFSSLPMEARRHWVKEANSTKWAWQDHEDEKPADKSEQLTMLYDIFMSMKRGTRAEHTCVGDSKALLERLRAATDDPPGGTKKRKGKGKGKRGKKTMASDEESAEETSGDESDAPVIEWEVGDITAVRPEDTEDQFWICKIEKIFTKEPKYSVAWFELIDDIDDPTSKKKRKKKGERRYYESEGKARVTSGAIIARDKFEMVRRGDDWVLPHDFFSDIVSVK